MDMTVKQCIEWLHDRDMLSECNYAALCEAVDDYHEAYARIQNSKSKYLIGEKVYVEKDYFNKSNKNHIALIEIESIAYDDAAKTYKYNYLYTEDEIYPTEVDLLTFLKTKFYQEYEDKVTKVCDDLKKLNERGDLYAIFQYNC